MSDTAERVPALITSALIVVSAVFPVLSLLATFFRYKIRRNLGKELAADDRWLAVAWISSLALSITVWTFARISGIDFYTVDPWDATVDSNLCLWIASWFNQITLTTVKIAILIFYKRIYPARSFQIVAWITIAAVSCWGILFFVLVIFWGDPISKVWTGVGVWRYDVEATGLANVGTSICLDILVLCFPLPVISKLRLSTSKKIAVGLIFWLGAFCCVCSIIRLVLLNKVLHEVVDSASNIGVQSTQFCFLIIESHCSIIAASLPCYGPLFIGTKGAESMIRSVRSVYLFVSRDDSIDTGLSDGTYERKPNVTSQQTHYGLQAELQQRTKDWIPQQSYYNKVVLSNKDGRSSRSDSARS
ncbi:hypothetical protein F4818DRAFT_452074 [Hypoxylon cercidicola]|nr:hypothetical protein F4818DRAFT_452074 [Hypoxylon cercidicola]